MYIVVYSFFHKVTNTTLIAREYIAKDPLYNVKKKVT